MKARAEESLYVGDVYSVDYIGATNAGMRAVLFDVTEPTATGTNPCGIRGATGKLVEELKLEAAKLRFLQFKNLMVQAIRAHRVVNPFSSSIPWRAR